MLKKLKDFYMVKTSLVRKCGRLENEKKITNYTVSIGVLFKIDKQLQKVNNKKSNHPIKMEYITKQEGQK